MSFASALMKHILSLEQQEDADIRYMLPFSTAIISAEYDSDQKILTVTYSNGRTYDYFDVSIQRWKAFENAASKGQYINYRIKPNYMYAG